MSEIFAKRSLSFDHGLGNQSSRRILSRKRRKESVYLLTNKQKTK